ncbi:TPA: glycosyltransferase family 2 protein, partial [Clostridium perfringens]|nr:glycosyltransferase family 2 protein [Clostridium perfringens]
MIESGGLNVDFNISIIVPVYNVESYLSDCLKSLQNQTYSNFEVIVVDDGSKDNSGIIAKEFCNKDKRFKYIKQENKGLGGARNTGLLNAKGEYIFFLDSDDKLTVNAVELMKNKIKNNNYDIILGRPVWCKNGEYLGTYIDHIFKDEDYLISSIQLKDVVIVTSQLIKKDLFFKNNIFFEEKVTSEDVEISLKLQNCSQKILCTNEIFYLRTEREDEENLSITQRFDCKIVKDRLNSSK